MKHFKRTILAIKYEEISNYSFHQQHIGLFFPPLKFYLLKKVICERSPSHGRRVEGEKKKSSQPHSQVEGLGSRSIQHKAFSILTYEGTIGGHTEAPPGLQHADIFVKEELEGRLATARAPSGTCDHDPPSGTLQAAPDRNYSRSGARDSWS